jgi:GDPmannose 4,6-dehydratase
MRRALITGVTGQDGSYLAEILLKKGYEVIGVVRRASTFNTARIDSLLKEYNVGPHFFKEYGDLSDMHSITRLIGGDRVFGGKTFKGWVPDEIYNLGAQSHVRVSFDIPEYTANVSGLGCLRFLEALRDFEQKTGKKIKFYQASSSEMFGASPPPQNEETRFHPRSPYAVSKVFAYDSVVNYREAYGMFAANGILFNHESPRRGPTFVTKKIARAVADIVNGKIDTLYLGNLDAKRDWGYAPEYAEAMWLILQQDKPDDYVIATGESHSVREFAEKAFKFADIEIEWRGEGIDEQGINKKTGKTVVKIDPDYFRPSEVNYLCGDASKAKKILGWEPKVKFDELVSIMMKYELEDKDRTPTY